MTTTTTRVSGLNCADKCCRRHNLRTECCSSSSTSSNECRVCIYFYTPCMIFAYMIYPIRLAGLLVSLSWIGSSFRCLFRSIQPYQQPSLSTSSSSSSNSYTENGTVCVCVCVVYGLLTNSCPLKRLTTTTCLYIYYTPPPRQQQHVDKQKE